MYCQDNIYIWYKSPRNNPSKKNTRKKNPRGFLVLFQVIFKHVVDIEEIGVGVFSEETVEIVVEFRMEVTVAIRTQECAMVYLGGETVTYEINMVELNNFNWQLATANITSGVLVVEEDFYAFASGYLGTEDFELEALPPMEVNAK